MSGPEADEVRYAALWKRAVSITVTLGMFPLYLPLRVTADITGWTAKRILTVSRRVHRWASPEVYGDAPRSLRRPFYSRRTVARLIETNNSLKRMNDRLSSELSGTRGAS